MFVIWIWSLHELGWIWVSVVLYMLFHCSANEPHVVRHSKLRARDGAWSIHLYQASSSVSCPVAAHLCCAWTKIALSSMLCPQIPPCLGDMNHLLDILWEYLERKSRISPRKSGLLLPGSSVTLADQAEAAMSSGGVHQGNSSLPGKDFVQSSFILLKRILCQDVHLMFITTLLLFFTKYPVQLLPSTLSTWRSHRRISLIVCDQTHQSTCHQLWPTWQNGKNSMKSKQHRQNKC